MTLFDCYLMVCLIAFITFVCRCLPFIFYKRIQGNEMIAAIQYYLPASIMLLLVLYTFKDIAGHSPSRIATELCASLCVALIHIRWRNALASISLGTLIFILLSKFPL